MHFLFLACIMVESRGWEETRKQLLNYHCFLPTASFYRACLPLIFKCTTEGGEVQGGALKREEGGLGCHADTLQADKQFTFSESQFSNLEKAADNVGLCGWL